MLEHLVDLDRSLFLLLNNGLECAWLDALMPVLTRLGDGVTTYLVAALVLLVAERRACPGSECATRRVLLGLAGLLVALVATGMTNSELKGFFGRARPPALFKDLAAAGQVVVYTVAGPLHSRSFPSGHTATAFAAALFVGLRVRRVLVPALLVALLVGLTRIYLGLHFPADIVAGAVVGSAWAVACAAAVRGLLGARTCT